MALVSPFLSTFFPSHVRSSSPSRTVSFSFFSLRNIPLLGHPFSATLAALFSPFCSTFFPLCIERPFRHPPLFLSFPFVRFLSLSLLIRFLSYIYSSPPTGSPFWLPHNINLFSSLLALRSVLRTLLYHSFARYLLPYVSFTIGTLSTSFFSSVPHFCPSRRYTRAAPTWLISSHMC